jgi:TetR/AcrR family transcriptional regulator, tetracycline repressor protein
MTVRSGQPEVRSARAGGGRVPGPALSREQVLDAGMEMLEQCGIDGLTIRGLAGKLGVAATAIYWHVGNKDQLLDGLAERVVARFGEVTAAGRDPSSRIVSIARILRERLLERPELVALVHRRGRTAELFQPARRVLVAEFVHAGVDGAHTALATHAVLNLVVGTVLLDRQLERQPEQRQAPEELWSPEDARGDPGLLAHLSHPVDEQHLFDFTLAVLVDSVIGGGAPESASNTSSA